MGLYICYFVAANNENMEFTKSYSIRQDWVDKWNYVYLHILDQNQFQHYLEICIHEFEWLKYWVW